MTEPPQPPKRLVLFIDNQNFYNGARRAFFNKDDPNYYGQFDPMKLGGLICARGVPGITRQLQEVRLYIGRPDATKDPKTYGPHMRQCAVWGKAGVTVISRTLRYPPDWPYSKAQEKGVDVALAVDFVAMAIDKKYDVGVIASTDSDLRPALEYVYKKCSLSCRVEAAAWVSSREKSVLSIPGKKIWCHRMDAGEYYVVGDLTDYRVSSPAP